MKNVSLFALLVVTLIGSFSIKAKAQDMIFSTFACIPSSCIEETLIPVYSGSARVDFAGTCTGGRVSAIAAYAKAVVGDLGECHFAYTPHAEVDRYRTTFEDDCQRLFSVDTVRQIGEVKLGGMILWEDEAEESCDGGTSGPTGAGSKPC